MTITLAIAAETSTQPSSSRLEIRLVNDGNPAGGGIELPALREGDPPLRVLNEVVLSDADLAAAVARPGQQGWEIDLRFTQAGGQKLQKFTSANIGKRVAFVVNGKVLSAPTIQSAIRGSAVITGGNGGFTESEARDIVRAASPAPATTQPAAAPEPPGA